eukprot:gene3781-6942_t
MKLLLFIFLILFSFGYCKLEVLHSFRWLNFTFEKQEDYKKYVSNKIYENCPLAGVKLDSKGNIYTSSPRWLSKECPATLMKLNTKSNLFEPFPSWEINKKLLKSVLGFEIDSKNRIWILDMALSENNIEKNGMKLIIWDLNKNELIKIYTFKEGIEVYRDNSFLNDIVVDDKNDIAYISDSGMPVGEGNSNFKSALLTYEMKTNRVNRYFESHKSMLPDPDVWIISSSKKCFIDEPMKTGVDGIALSCDKKTLYWTPLTSRSLYSISTKDLFKNDETKIKFVGHKKIASDGLICSNKNECFVTDLETNSIYSFNTKKNFKDSYKRVIKHDQFLIWPDTFSIFKNSIYFVSNNLCTFLKKEMNFNNFNFYISKLKIDGESYVHGCLK